MPNLNELMPLSEAARRVPGERTVSAISVWRWTTEGLRAPDGSRVKLAAYRCGKRLCTTEADMVAFFAAAGGQTPALAATGNVTNA